MRELAMILSLIILVLSMKPCSDDNNAEDKHQDEISTNHNYQDDCDDSCAITCICCGMSIAYHFIEDFDLKLNIKISTLDFSTYQSNYCFDFHFNIWQPPQLIS